MVAASASRPPHEISNSASHRLMRGLRSSRFSSLSRPRMFESVRSTLGASRSDRMSWLKVRTHTVSTNGTDEDRLVAAAVSALAGVSRHRFMASCQLV
jgi:hypothetical protein